MENSTKAKEYIGRHFIVEFYDCEEESLTNALEVETALVQAAVISGTTVVDTFSHDIPETGGITAVIVIQESHITCHTVPQKRYAAIDLYTCGKSSEPMIGLESLKSFFKPKSHQFTEYQRGDIQKMPFVQQNEYQQFSAEEKEQSWWFKDLIDSSGIGTSIKMKGYALHKQKSQFQWINVYQSATFGKILVLDGAPQLSEVDEVYYHEMFVHVPMFAYPDPKRILIIGGGDGGVAREVLKHESVEKLIQVEIDQEVVDVSKKYLPQLSSAYGNDPRFDLIIGDGIQYVKEAQDETFDIVIIDSTDPGGPSVPLFSAQFYTHVKRILKPNGIVISQAESPIGYLPEVIQSIFSNLRSAFGNKVYCYQVNVPIFTGGQTFSFSSKGNVHPFRDLNEEKIAEFCKKNKLIYYSAEIHKASFVVPRYIRKIIFSEQLWQIFKIQINQLTSTRQTFCYYILLLIQSLMSCAGQKNFNQLKENQKKSLVQIITNS